jgi:general secretion pathway protein G
MQTSMNSRRDPLATRAARASLRGFTLIEIMVVVIIIGLLAAVIVPQVFGQVDKARIAKAKQDIQAIETALTMYKLDNFRYPTSEQGLAALVTKPADPTIRNWREGGYLRRATRDPWGADYQYRSPGSHGGEYDLFSMGPNGQVDDAQSGQSDDIGNWNLDR